MKIYACDVKPLLGLSGSELLSPQPLRILRDIRHNAVHGILMVQRYFGGMLL